MKTYATLGPACIRPETLRQMLRLGLTGFRLNLSHTTLEKCAPWLTLLREASAETGTDPELIIDMRGSELRSGSLTRPILLREGDSIRFGKRGLPLDDDILAALKEGQEMLLDAAYGVTGIMQPFVRSRRDLMEVRQAMERHGIADLTLFAKVEDETGLNALPDWMALCDVVTIARGDLGSNLPLWQLPRAQKKISALCRQADKPFLVVTQLLHHMVTNPVPTRAEVSDIYNACLDGAACLMLTNETAQGRYPAESVDWLLRVAQEGEKDR